MFNNFWEEFKLKFWVWNETVNGIKFIYILYMVNLTVFCITPAFNELERRTKT